MISLPVIVERSDDYVLDGATQGQWTYADWEALDHQDRRYEIIDGVLYMSTAPSFFHQWIMARVFTLFGVPAMQRGLGYAVMAPIGVIMPGSDPVQPDFVFVTRTKAQITWRVNPSSNFRLLKPGRARWEWRVMDPMQWPSLRERF